MTSNETEISPPRCEEDIERFLFSSSAHFVGETEDACYQLRAALPSFGNKNWNYYPSGNPHSNSYFALSIRVQREEPTGKFQVIETYKWMPEQVSALFSAFFGKLIRSHGHIQHGLCIMVPDLVIPPTYAFSSPPFNSKARKPSGPELNLLEAQNVVEAYFFGGARLPSFSKILSSSTFYHLALESWSLRPTLAYVSLVSAIEALLDLRDYSDDELFDETRLEDFRAIEKNVPNGSKVVARLRGSLYSIRRKFALFIEDRLPETYFGELECPENMNLRKDVLPSAVKAAYDIRSRYLHTGDTTGLAHLSTNSQNAEVQLGTPVISDPKLKRFLTDAPTLSGLERIVATLLRTEISRWVDESKIQFGKGSVGESVEDEVEADGDGGVPDEQ